MPKTEHRTPGAPGSPADLPARALAAAYALAGAAYLGAAAWSARAVYALGDSSLYAEGGPLEVAQAWLLGASCLVFLLAAALAKGPARWMRLFCALLSFSFVCREIDLAIDLSRALPFLAPDDHREPLLAAAFAAMALYAAFRFRQYRRAGVAFLRSRPGALLLAAGAMLLAGSAFEQMKSLERHAYLEEILELGGCLLILLSACAAAVDATRA